MDTLRLAQRLRLVVDRLRRVVRSSAGMVEGLSRPQEAVLSCLERRSALTTADLARSERVAPQAMGTIVGQLETRGLVEKSPHPTDRRRTLVFLTPEGAATMKRVGAIRDRDLAQMLDRTLDGRQRRTLTEALSIIESLGDEW